jgi:hypothetical protein
MFANAIHFHPSLIVTGKVRILPLEWSLIGSSTLVGSSLAYKYYMLNTLTYYDTAKIMALKRFKVFHPGLHVIKLFCP